MSISDTELDAINNICTLSEEVIAIAFEISHDSKYSKEMDLIRSKVFTIKNKAQRMENRLREYKAAIESLGFKRVKAKKKEK